MADQPDFDLSASPGHLLHRAQQFAADRFAEATGDMRITQRQFAVLSAVARDEGLSQTKLVQVTGIDRSTLAELVSRMAQKNLLVREKAPGDGRANSIRLSDEGRSLYQTALAGAAAADEAIIAALPKNKRTSFVEALARISRRIDMDAETLKAEALKEKEKAKKAAAKAKEKDKKKKKKKKKK
ncbi:MarR family transcriptional regulator [Marinicauda salina]|uniref:MarR family transcriptional regulator n=1 Tax=Marinicauda salina TaxID=2135793 RepID=A0A2U2BW69_9PROT|nr:MarR family transcriptional regulator [Marinicauda salina]PWE18263.1 MarR family transcriptional regulator [Marinicauda salina]